MLGSFSSLFLRPPCWRISPALIFQFLLLLFFFLLLYYSAKIPAGVWLERFILSFILLNVVAFSLQTVKDFGYHKVLLNSLVSWLSFDFTDF